MNIANEYGKRCTLCHKNKQSRIYPMKINNRWHKLCKDCWDKQNDKRGSR